MRTGQEIENKLCTKLRGVVDINTSYDSISLISLFRYNENFILRDMLGWLFGGADFFGKDSQKESYVLGKLNQYIIDNPVEGEEAVVLTALDEPNGFIFYGRYGHGKTAEDKEQVKQALCDLFSS